MTFPVGGISAILELQGAAQFEQGILGAQRSLTLARGTATETAAAMDKLDAAVARAGTASSEASAGTTKLRAAQLSAVAATERYNTLLNNSSASVARLASAEASMLRANDRLTSSMPTAAVKQLGTAAEEANGFLARAKGGVVGFMDSTARLGLGLAGFEAVLKGVELVKAGADFQKTMLLIQTNANASASEVKNMSSAVLSMAGETATAPIELANALYHVEQNGLRGQQALDALRIGAEGAKVGMADVEDTTNAMTFAIASGISGVQNMQKAMGFLITTVGTGDMRMTDLNAALGTGILSVAKGFGATLRDVSAVLATLGDNGIRGADAATGLRQALMGFAKPAVGGADALKSVGLAMTSLRDDMEKHGLVYAMNDLEQHMTAAGVTGTKVGGFITQAFGRKAGASLSVLMGEMDRVNGKFAEVGKGGDAFASKWQATTQTVSFSFQKLAAEAQVAGIKIFETVGPAVGKVAAVLANDLPKAISFVHAALEPLISTFGVLASTVAPIAHALGAVGSTLAPLAPVLKGVTGAVAAMWVAWKGYGLAWTAINTVQDLVIGFGGKASAAFATVTGAGDRMASQSVVTGRVMQVEFAQIEASALQAAAAQDRAAALQAQSYADQVGASKAATDAQVADADERAAAAWTAARASAAAAAVAAGAAEDTSVTIVASGDAAKFGWASLLGPIGLAAVGIATIVTMFGKSGDAAKQWQQDVSDAAKAYSDIANIASQKDVLGAITDQFTSKNIPQQIDALNQALGHTVVTSQQAATALAKVATGNSKPLDDVLGKLGGLAMSAGMFSSTGQKAATTMQALAAQGQGLSDAIKKDLTDTKALAGVSSSIDEVSQAAIVGSDTAKQYAQMLGIAVDKNGVAAVSAKTLAAAVQTVTQAEESATQTGSTFLDALNKFSQSAGTAADRATLIGATLKAANGDALNFAAQMNGAATASAQFSSDVASNAKTAKESTGSYLKSLIDLKTGTIDYSKAAAAPLITDLQGMQTGAMNAAQAMYQHELATKNATAAADDAYKVYESQTKGALVDEATHLGLTHEQATKLADAYFGMPKQVKTLIEQEGANPVINVLNQIGQQLSYLTGHPWKMNVGANVDQALSAIAQVRYAASQLRDKSITITEYQSMVRGATAVGPHAAGGSVADGWFTAGEEGYELGYKQGSNVQFFSHAKSVAMTGLDRVPGYAAGTAEATVGATIAAAVTPSSSSSVSGSLASFTSLDWTALLDQRKVTAAYAAFQQLEAELKRMQAADQAAEKAAKAHAQELANEAYSAGANKKALEAAARAASQAASALTASDNERESKLKSLASTAQASYSKIAQAAKTAASAAASAASALISSVQSQVDALKSSIQSFESSVVSGISGDYSIATLWGQVGSNAQAAAAALQSAQQAVNAATPDTAGLAAAQKAQADATSKLAAAHQALAAAQAAVAAGTGTPGQYATLTQAQQTQSDAVSNLAAANQALQSAQQAVANTAGPTADQLQTLAQAQQAYNQAIAANSVTGLENNLSQILASTQQFAADLNSLVNEGAGQDLISQIAGMGSTAGDQLAQQLLAAGPGAINALQTTMTQIANVAGQEGDVLGQDFFGKGTNALQQLVAGMQNGFPSIKAALAPIVAELNAMFTFSPTVVNGNGTSSHVTQLAHTVGWLATNYHESVAALVAANPSLSGLSTSTVVPAGTTLNVPSFASGVTNFAGGLAKVHDGELLALLPPRTDVIPRSKVPSVVGMDTSVIETELRGLRREVNALAVEIGREVAVQGAGLYARAGAATGVMLRRAQRKGAM